MAKDDVIEVDGKVLEIIPGGKFKVQLENGYTVEAHVSGKIRMNYIRMQKKRSNSASFQGNAACFCTLNCARFSA